MLKAFPEVEWAVGKAGRAETSTDPSPTNMNETIIHLKPEGEWRSGLTREKLVGEMDEKLRMPGVTNIWTQPIINRIEMLTTGIRTQVGIKIFGNDLKRLRPYQGRSPKRSKRFPVPSMFTPKRSAVRPISISRSIARRPHVTASMLRSFRTRSKKASAKQILP